MKILITGGREFSNENLMFKVLDIALQVSGGDITIVHGDARGADKLSQKWADLRNMPTKNIL